MEARSWTGSWTGPVQNSSATSVISAMARHIVAANVYRALSRGYGKEKVYKLGEDHPDTLESAHNLDISIRGLEEKSVRDVSGAVSL